MSVWHINGGCVKTGTLSFLPFVKRKYKIMTKNVLSILYIAIIAICMTVFYGCKKKTSNANYNDLYTPTRIDNGYVPSNIPNNSSNIDFYQVSPIRQPIQQASVPRTDTPDDAYSNGYEQGYEDGMSDGSNGRSNGYSYDDSNDYYDYYETRYVEGYEEGYEEGFGEVLSQYEEECEEQENEEDEEW